MLKEDRREVLPKDPKVPVVALLAVSPRVAAVAGLQVVLLKAGQEDQKVRRAPKVVHPLVDLKVGQAVRVVPAAVSREGKEDRLGLLYCVNLSTTLC